MYIYIYEYLWCRSYYIECNRYSVQPKCMLDVRLISSISWNWSRLSKSTTSFPSHYRYKTWRAAPSTLEWRNNGRDGDSNHQPHHCLLNRLFRRRSTKTSKLRVTGLCEGNPPMTGEFPAQRASSAENVSIWWRHHVYAMIVCNCSILQIFTRLLIDQHWLTMYKT